MVRLIPYIWHATPEPWGFSQGTTFIIVILAILVDTALISFSSRDNPGARSSTYVLLDAL